MRDSLEFFEIELDDELVALTLKKKAAKATSIGTPVSTGAGSNGGWSCTSLTMWCACKK